MTNKRISIVEDFDYSNDHVHYFFDNKKVYAIPREKRYSSIYLAKILNVFGHAGGFDIIL